MTGKTEYKNKWQAENKDRKIESNSFIDDNEKLTFTNNTESEG